MTQQPALGIQTQAFSNLIETNMGLIWQNTLDQSVIATEDLVSDVDVGVTEQGLETIYTTSLMLTLDISSF